MDARDKIFSHYNQRLSDRVDEIMVQGIAEHWARDEIQAALDQAYGDMKAQVEAAEFQAMKDGELED